RPAAPYTPALRATAPPPRITPSPASPPPHRRRCRCPRDLRFHQPVHRHRLACPRHPRRVPLHHQLLPLRRGQLRQLRHAGVWTSNDFAQERLEIASHARRGRGVAEIAPVIDRTAP